MNHILTSGTLQPIDIGTLQNGLIVSLEQAQDLVWDMSRQEIIEALFTIRDDKSPGAGWLFFMFL